MTILLDIQPRAFQLQLCNACFACTTRFEGQLLIDRIRNVRICHDASLAKLAVRWNVAQNFVRKLNGNRFVDVRKRRLNSHVELLTKVIVVYFP